LAKRESAAVVLQKNWRARVAHRKYVAVRALVIRMQALARGRLAADDFRRKRLAAILLQSRWRGRCARNLALALRLEAARRRQDAAVTIQKNWRTFRERQNFILTRRLIIHVQSLIRAKQAAKKFKLARKSVTTIRWSFLLGSGANPTTFTFTVLRQHGSSSVLSKERKYLYF
jgi:myosin heavy subunit